MLLVAYTEKGNKLRTHADVPPWIREFDLYQAPARFGA